MIIIVELLLVMTMTWLIYECHFHYLYTGQSNLENDVTKLDHQRDRDKGDGKQPMHSEQQNG